MYISVFPDDLSDEQGLERVERLLDSSARGSHNKEIINYIFDYIKEYKLWGCGSVT